MHWYIDYSANEALPMIRFNGVQSLALETALKRRDDGTYLYTQTPVEEVKNLRAGKLFDTKKGITVNEKDDNLLEGVVGQVYEIEAIFDLNKSSATTFGFKVREGEGQETIIKYDVINEKMILDISKAGVYANDILEWELTPTKDGKIKIRAIVDNLVIDVFGNDGEVHFLDLYTPDMTSIGMSFYSEGGEVYIDELTVYDLKSIYTKKSVVDSKF